MATNQAARSKQQKNTNPIQFNSNQLNQSTQSIKRIELDDCHDQPPSKC